MLARKNIFQRIFTISFFIAFTSFFALNCYANTLLESAKNGDIESLTKEIQKNIDIHIKDEHGHTPLMLAVIHNHINAVDILLAEGANINERTNDGKTVLMMASENNNLQLVELLLNNGASPYARTNSNKDAFSIATEKGYNTITDEIIHFTMQDLNVERTIYSSRENFLEYAKKGDYKNIEKALKTEDINIRDANGMTALMFAAKNGHHHTSNILLKNGANPNARNDGGWTALMLASVFGNKRVVQTFIDNNVDLNAVDDDNKSALDLAVDEGHKDIINLLKQHNAK